MEDRAGHQLWRKAQDGDRNTSPDLQKLHPHLPEICVLLSYSSVNDMKSRESLKSAVESLCLSLCRLSFTSFSIGVGRLLVDFSMAMIKFSRSSLSIAKFSSSSMDEPNGS